MRYLPLTPRDRSAMLAKIGVSSVDELFCDVPAAARQPRFALPAHAGAMEVKRSLAPLAAQNTAAASRPFFSGAPAEPDLGPPSADPLIPRSALPTSHTP